MLEEKKQYVQYCQHVLYGLDHVEPLIKSVKMRSRGNGHHNGGDNGNTTRDHYTDPRAHLCFQFWTPSGNGVMRRVPNIRPYLDANKTRHDVLPRKRARHCLTQKTTKRYHEVQYGTGHGARENSSAPNSDPRQADQWPKLFLPFRHTWRPAGHLWATLQTSKSTKQATNTIKESWTKINKIRHETKLEKYENS